MPDRDETKAEKYCLARLDGATDDEANDAAGYEGRTPGDAHKLWLMVRYLSRQDDLSWVDEYEAESTDRRRHARMMARAKSILEADGA